MPLLFQYVDEHPENLFVFSGLEKPSSQRNRLITGIVVSCGFLLCDVPRPTRPLFCADIAASSGRALPFLPLYHTPCVITRSTGKASRRVHGPQFTAPFPLDVRTPFNPFVFLGLFGVAVSLDQRFSPTSHVFGSGLN